MYGSKLTVVRAEKEEITFPLCLILEITGDVESKNKFTEEEG